jgi:formamidopyrimidine-DNA glycosylase
LTVPELPDIDVYVESLRERIDGEVLDTVRVNTPFLVRSFDPPLSEAHGRRVTGVRRLGKRVVIGLEPDYWLVVHLMVAGRLQWRDDRVTLRGKQQLATFDFNKGSLLLTEAGSKKRASLYFVKGDTALEAHDPGGIEVLTCSESEFTARLLAENRTLKRALTNPRTFSGIGNAYSDEILHAARLSPVRLTSRLTAEEQSRLYSATVDTLTRWRDRLRREAGDEFPKKVTAFRDDMAVHGKFGKPCPACSTKVARIRYKSNETNYCPGCQTGGKLLADRSLSRLLKDDWPDSV